MLASLDAPESLLNTLAVIDGAGEPITPTEIGERTLKSSGTMTGTLDQLEHRGWIRRIPNTEDRRSLLIEITDDGQAVVDRFLPGIRALEQSVLADLDPSEMQTLLDLLAKVLQGAARVAAEPPIPLEGRRVRTRR